MLFIAIVLLLSSSMQQQPFSNVYMHQCLFGNARHGFSLTPLTIAIIAADEPIYMIYF